MNKPDPSKIILTYTSSQWFPVPEAVEVMADLVHDIRIPITWLVDFETATVEKNLINEYHEKYGDEIALIKKDETMAQWKEAFPWSKCNCAGGMRMLAPGEPEKLAKDGIEGYWGYCDFQIGCDGITHWGCPWGMFRVSDKVPIIPSRPNESEIIGIPWTLRDIHKTFNLKQAINFSTDPVEALRSKDLDRGEDITFFQEMFDELLVNTAWNDRVYCCIHEEAENIYVYPGKTCTREGTDYTGTMLMRSALKGWLKYAKDRGATVMTLPEAIEDYKTVSKGGVIPSTLLTSDKHHGRIYCYVAPLPPNAGFYEMGSAGHFPDHLFHVDEDCMLIFEHPSITPKFVLNYKQQRATPYNSPYQEESVLPQLISWDSTRKGNEKTYTYWLSSWYSIPYGLAEWGNFKNWRVADTNCTLAKIIDDRLLFMRMDFDFKLHDETGINDECREGSKYWVKLEYIE